MVAALMDSRLSRTAASSFKCPGRSIASTSPAINLAEALATDSIGGIPNNRQCFLNGFVVDPRPLSRFRRFPPPRSIKRADRVLAMKACHLDELVKDLFLLVPGGGPIARRHRLN
jgi:hypothetical protein